MNAYLKLFDLKGKSAIVTGGASGIGRAIALKLAEFGANVVVADVKISDVEAVVKEIESMGGKSIAIKVDVSRIDDVNDILESTCRVFGGVDILINNAGILGSFDLPLRKTSEKEWNIVLNVNLKGVFFCLKSVAEVMIKQNSGKIVNLSSIAGKTGGTLGFQERIIQHRKQA